MAGTDLRIPAALVIAALLPVRRWRLIRVGLAWGALIVLTVLFALFFALMPYA